ncbi:MAG: VOC family protein [Gammaproteobacteria bacterium]|nr:VOC family protein [Gammaproteobacteria bacterium]
MRVLSVLLAVLASSSLQSLAAPVPEARQVPIDLRRTTLVVEDMERTLDFYRDALGLKVVYDNVIRTPRNAGSDDDAERSLRLVFLEANDDYIGLIGVIEYRKPIKPLPAEKTTPFSIGSMVFVFNAKNLDETFARASQVPGVNVLSEPEETSYPSYDGSGTIPVRVSVLQDPDGYVVELNQLLVDSPR